MNATVKAHKKYKKAKIEIGTNILSMPLGMTVYNKCALINNN